MLCAHSPTPQVHVLLVGKNVYSSYSTVHTYLLYLSLDQFWTMTTYSFAMQQNKNGLECHWFCQETSHVTQIVDICILQLTSTMDGVSSPCHLLMDWVEVLYSYHLSSFLVQISITASRTTVYTQTAVLFSNLNLWVHWDEFHDKIIKVKSLKCEHVTYRFSKSHVM